MVELQTVGAVTSQQHPALWSAYFSAPLGEPFDDLVHRQLAAAGFQYVLFDGRSQQVVPAAGWTSLYPTGEGRSVDNAGALPKDLGSQSRFQYAA